MIINKVDMNNILSHKLTKVEFPPGVIAIVGPNGAGKTSIVDAISFALFGSHSRSGKAIKPIIRLGSTAGQVEVTFTAHGRRYVVRRVISKSRSSDAVLYLIQEDGRPKGIARGAKSVTREISKIIGIRAELAKRLYITGQGELESILTDKDKRLELLNLLLRIKDIEKAYEYLRYVLSEIRRVRDLYEKEAETLRESVSRLQAAKRELEELKRRLGELREKEKLLQEELEAREARYKEAKQIEKQIHMLEKEHKAVTEKLALTKRILQEAEERLSEAEKAKRALTVMKEEIERLSPAEEALEAKRRLLDLEKRYRQRLEQKDAILKQLEHMEELEQRARELEEVRKRVERLEKEAENYIKLKERVEAIRRDLEPKKDEIRRLQRNITSEIGQLLGIEAKDATAIEERLEAIKASIERLLEKNRAKKENLAKRLAALDQQKREIEENLDKLASAAGVCPLCRRPLDEKHRIQLIQQLRNEKRRIENEIQRLRFEIRLAENEIASLEDKRRELEKLINRLRSRLERLRLLTEDVKQLEAQLEEINQAYLVAFTAYKDYEEARNRLRELEPVEEKLNELRLQKARLADIEAEIKELQGEIDAVRRRLEEKTASMGISIDDVEAAVEKLSKLRLEAARLQAKIMELDMLREKVEMLREEIASLEEEKLHLETELERLRSQLKEYGDVEDALEEARQRYHRLREEIASVEGRIGKLEDDVKNLEVLEERLKRLQAGFEAYHKAYEAVEKLRAALGPQGLQRLVRVKARNVIEYHLRDMLARFNLDFVDVRLGDDYEAIIVAREGEKTVDMLSGGERVALAIAYRLAIARAVGGRLGSLVMDEPTVYLDEERKRELVNIIRYGLEATGLQQLIIVTHDRELEEAADHVIEVRKEEGVSQVIVREPAEGLEAL